MKYKLFFDGSCLPTNPSRLTFSAFIVKDESNSTIYQHFIREEHKQITSCNYSEWKGLNLCLNWLLENDFNECSVHGDSQMVIHQINGKYKIKENKMYTSIAKETLSLYKEKYDRFKDLKFIWIPRELNCEVDALTR